jgi:hypothetical protein
MVKREAIVAASKKQVPRDPFKLKLAVMLARVVSRFFWHFNRRLLYLVADPKVRLT